MTIEEKVDFEDEQIEGETQGTTTVRTSEIKKPKVKSVLNNISINNVNHNHD